MTHRRDRHPRPKYRPTSPLARLPFGDLVPDAQDPSLMRDEQGRQWISLEESDNRGAPRELVLVASGTPCPVPESEADRSIRRRVLLTWLARDGGFPRGEAGEAALLAEIVLLMITASLSEPSKVSDSTRCRVQALASYCKLLDISEDEEGFRKTIQQIVQDWRQEPPTVLEVAREYQRWYAANGTLDHQEMN